MPLGRRRPLARDAAIGAVAYKHGEHQAEEAQAAAPPPPEAPSPAAAPADATTEKINRARQHRQADCLRATAYEFEQ